MPSDIFTDQLGRNISLPYAPQRIISVVPSQTELLFDLGAGEQLVGITKFCIHPAKYVKHINKVGGTKQLNINLIKSLEPDLIIANKEENERSQIEELMQLFPVWISDINTLHDACDMIKSVGEITGTRNKAIEIAGEVLKLFNAVIPVPDKLKVLYLIWRKPYMVAGKATFIDAMLSYCGFINAVNINRYPELSITDLANLNPDLILLSSEPYPFKEKHIEEFEVLFPKAKARLVDGELFSWYGSRLLQAPQYFKWLINSL